MKYHIEGRLGGVSMFVVENGTGNFSITDRYTLATKWDDQQVAADAAEAAVAALPGWFFAVCDETEV